MNTFYGKLQKRNGKLTHHGKLTEASFNAFTGKIREGASIDVYMEAVSDDGLLSQLARVHKMIRVLSIHIGESFPVMKYLVKKEAGLCCIRKEDGRQELICKSFADCSYDELDLAIHAAIDIGNKVNLSLQ